MKWCFFEVGWRQSMKEEFDIQMSTMVLYRYMLYHAYRGLAGLLGTFLGLVLVVAFLQNHAPLYLIFGIVLLAYTPVTLHLQAAKQFQANEAWKKPLHYCMDNEGIVVSQGEAEQKISWQEVTKAVSSADAILVYTGKNNASVLPKRQLGERLAAVVQIISTHVDPKKVHIRGN